jgi:hypothetical protein
MNPEQIKEILNLHQKWLTNEPDGVRADLSGADLSGADLSEADLSGANLRGADLRGADLRGADLHRADLRGADLRGANLHRANLHRADLSEANLSRADLSEADLRGANLRGADLRGADLSRADLSEANLSRADLRGATGLNGFIGVLQIGSRKDQTVWDSANDIVYCGCFRGSMADFARRVEETHASNPVCLAEYRLAIKFAVDIKATRDELRKLEG